jgi:hypothetical protein
MDDVYIFTEGYDCGLILKKCLETFFKYHNISVNVFGRENDFKEIGHFDNVIYHDLSYDVELQNCFNNGHLGTAHIFSKVIKELSGDKKYIIHFDSDVIFRSESISLLINRLKEGYDLVGPRRCYKNNLNGRNDLNHLQDVTQTYFYGFNKDKITNYDFITLRNMVVGFHNPLGHPILDYFDPVSFDILNNSGKPYYLDFNQVGAQEENGNRINKYGEISKDCDFGDNLIHFAGIGSGMKFYNVGRGNVPVSYYDWAIKRYALYMKLMYDVVINQDLIDDNAYKIIKPKL